MKTKTKGALLLSALFATSVARADRMLSDFDDTGFSSVGSATTETVGATFDTVTKAGAMFAPVSGDLNYEPAGLNLTGLTGFNVTYTLALGTGSSSSVFLGFFVRDLDGSQVSDFIMVPASTTFVTSFVPITTEGEDLAQIRFVRFSSSDPDFSATGSITYQIDNITAVGVVVPEPATWVLLGVGVSALGLTVGRRMAA